MNSNPQRIRFLFGLSLVLIDIVAVTLAFGLAYWLRVNIDWPSALPEATRLSNYAALLVLHAVGVMAWMAFSQQYIVPRAPSRIDQFYAIVRNATLGVLFGTFSAIFLLRNNALIANYPRVTIVYGWLLSILFLTFGRTIHHTSRDWLRRRGVAQDRLLIVGTGEQARIILQRILWSPQLGYKIIGVIATRPTALAQVLGVPILGETNELQQLINEHSIDEVILAAPEEGHRATVRLISECQHGRVSIKVFPDMFQFMTSEAGIDDLGGLPLLSVRDFASRGYWLVFKRLMDVTVSALGLLVLSPLLLLLAVAIRLESPGPVFFIQERMGLDGKPFRMIKFRSMRSDSEAVGPGWTVENDPRRTQIGSILRKLNIDEVPQLINVLLGEMSLVGPRPEQPHYVEQFQETIPSYMERHREKAGLTGWAQIHGLRGDTSIAERTNYDLWYSENWSLLLDVKIVIRTIWQIFTGQNNGS